MLNWRYPTIITHQSFIMYWFIIFCIHATIFVGMDMVASHC